MNKEQMIEKIMKDMKQYLYEFDAEILSKSLNKHLQDLESINEENKEVENDKHTC